MAIFSIRQYLISVFEIVLVYNCPMDATKDLNFVNQMVLLYKLCAGVFEHKSLDILLYWFDNQYCVVKWDNLNAK